MPQIEKIFRLTITPRQFVNSCELSDLYELELEIERKRKRIAKLEDFKIKELKLPGPQE